MQSVSVAYAQLNEAVFKRLRNRPRYVLLKDISAVTGIKETWLKNYSSNRIIKPDVTNLEKLHRYFELLD